MIPPIRYAASLYMMGSKVRANKVQSIDRNLPSCIACQDARDQFHGHRSRHYLGFDQADRQRVSRRSDGLSTSFMLNLFCVEFTLNSAHPSRPLKLEDWRSDLSTIKTAKTRQEDRLSFRSRLTGLVLDPRSGRRCTTLASMLRLLD